MQPQTTSLFLTMLLIGIVSGCGRQAPPVAQPEDPPPAAFQTAAEKFKARAGTNRLAEAKDLIATLPSCVTSTRDTGPGRIRALDTSHPTYRLSKGQLLAASGQPHSVFTNSTWGERLSYDVGTNRLGHWYLSIELHNDLVILSDLSAALPE